MASTFLAALDVSCVAIALPTIAVDLDGARDFIWVGSAVRRPRLHVLDWISRSWELTRSLRQYALTSTALIPWTGSLAGIYGRKLTLLVSVAIFAAGSAICGAAPNMTVMIVGRSIAGIGGGGIVVLTSIVVIDLIPLAERGPFFGLLGSMWGLASTVGPPLSGALTTIGQWRWLFWCESHSIRLEFNRGLMNPTRHSESTRRSCCFYRSRALLGRQEAPDNV